MIRRFTIALMVVMSFWVISVAVVIERQNAAAGNFLPRRDLEAGTKWRRSFGEKTPRDELRELVRDVGMFQYLLCPVLIALGVFCLARFRGLKGLRNASTLAIIVGIAALFLAFYRGYYSSMGY